MDRVLVRIFQRAQKFRIFRLVPVAATQCLVRYLVGKQILNVHNSFSTACRKVDIKDFRIHDLRHTCAAWLVTEVRDLLGHSTINMTECYVHMAPENVRAAVKLLEGDQSRSGHVSDLKVTKEVN